MPVVTLRILIIVDCYLPSRKSVAQLTRDLACELASKGHDVTVLAPSEGGRHGLTVASEAPITVIRYPLGPTKGVSLAIRALKEMSISLAALLGTRSVFSRTRFDSIVFYSPSIFFGPLVNVLKRRWHAKTYLVLRDIFPDWAVDAGVMRRGLAYRVFKVFERMQYRVADVIGVETTGSFRYFEGTEFQSKIELLRNWTTTAPIPAAGLSTRELLGLGGKVVFFYGGNLGVAQDMDNLMRLARRMMTYPDVHFLVVGDGSERRRLERLVDEEHMSNVTIHGPVEPQSYLSILGEFDVGVITLDRRLKTFSNTGKLVGYLRCGLPVLASYNEGNDLAALLRDSGAGLGSVNGEDDVFYRNAVRLRDATTRTEMRRKAKELLRADFSVDKTAAQILRHLESDPTTSAAE